MKTEYDPKTHTGKVNGVYWPSATQVLKESGLEDLENVPKDILENKRRIGVRVHHATCLLDSGELDDEHFRESFPDCVGYLEAYKSFREIERFEPIHKEERLFSKKWKFHGCPDEVATRESDGAIVIIDYKTAWKVYPAVSAQLEAYRILVEECRGLKVRGLYSLQLKSNGHYDMKEHKNSECKTDFLYALHLHWRRREFYK